MEWQTDGSVAFRANNGKFVATKKSGHLYANAEAPEETSKFFFYLINRSVASADIVTLSLTKRTACMQANARAEIRARLRRV